MRVYVRFPLLTLLYALALNAALLGFLSTTDVAAREGAAPLSFISEHDIIITKTVVGATPALSWTFDIESTTEVTRLIVPPTGGTAWHSVHLEERTITITEQSQTGYLVNYVCYREQPEGELDYEFEEITRGQGNQVVLSGFGEFDLTLHCAFTNTQLAKVTIIKEANPADGTDFGFETDLPFNGPPLLDGSLASEGTRAGQVLSPYGLAIDTAGNIFVADESNNRIQKFDSNGNFLRAWGWGVDDSTATFQICTAGCRAGLEGNGAGQFDRPRNIAINSAGHVYVTDAANDRVQVFDSNGIFQFSWGSSGTAESQFTFPNGIAVDSVDNVYIADNNHRVQKFAANGDFLLMWGRGVKDGATTHQICTAVDAPCQQGTTGTGAGQFRFPHSIAINSADHVYVSDRLNNRIQRFTVDGDYVDEWNGTNSASGALNSPRALTVDPDDNLLIIDNNKYRVVKLTSDWTFIIEWGTFGRVPGYFFEPSGIAVAADGTIYVSDEVNHLIQKFTDIDLTLDHALPDDLDSITMSATTYVTGGLYAITETHIAAGWSFDSVACESAGPGAAPAVNSATVNFDLAMTQIVTCTYTNRSRGDLTIVKQANPDTADPFDIVVTTLVTKTLLYESFSDFGP